MGVVVCMIPARGGSKGIPKKNLLPLAGKPLVGWSIDQALNTPSLKKHVYVTSDSEEILQIARQRGAKGVLRPAEISGDTASSESALIHCLSEIRKEVKETIDYIVFLQATSPVRKPDDIEQAIQTIKREGADSLLSVTPLRDYFLWARENGQGVSKNFDYKNRKRRQEIEKTFLENGSIYVFKPEILEKTNNRLGGKITFFEMEKSHSFQIDDQDDLGICEHYLKKLYT